jgi:PAS domain S-box-containing protein
MENSTEKYRVVVLVALLAISVFLTYYFHAILMLGTVFSHFFYIPIILTALWWEKKSILVALFLGGLVVFSSLVFRPEALTLNDYARALMFVVIAFVVATLSERLKGQQKELRKQRDWMQQYLDVAGVLIVVIDGNHIIRLINRRGCEMLGYREEDLIGRDWFETVVPEKGRAERMRLFDGEVAGGVASLERREIPVITRTGEERVLSWQNTVLTDENGHAVGVIGSGSDITDRIRAEEELRAAHDEANLYLDIMVHDINNANAVTLGYTDLLIEVLEGREKQMVRKLRSGINRSIEIIQNVSTIRRLRSRNAVIKPVNLDAVIRAEIAHHPDATIVYEGRPVYVAADDLFPEVFTNLIGNSIKFGEPGVKIRVRVDEHEDGVDVSVEDTGPGVPDSVKPFLFTRFKRGTTTKSGKGLGLYIARTLIERYGGSIRAEDRVPGKPGEGAAFRITLPRAPRSGQHPDFDASSVGEKKVAGVTCIGNT